MLSRQLRLLSLIVGVVVQALGSMVASASAQDDVAMRLSRPRFLLAAATPATRVEVDASSVPLLRRRISLRLEGATVSDALKAIANQSDVLFIYDPALVASERRVTVSAEGLTVAAALTEVLFGSGLDVLVTDQRHLAIVPRPVRVMLATGTIVGRVTDAKTQTALAGATVVVEGTSRSTTTVNDGRYRITDVAPGTYTLRARYIGYAPGTASVSVSGDQEATADFGLEKSAQRLNEVVTTGTVVPTEVKALPMPVTVISDSLIAEQRPHTIQELFRQAVPTAVSWDLPAYPSQTAFSVRGASTLNAGSGQMKVFVDNIELANPTYAPVDPNSIERVEVVRGPQAAAIYGPDAIGGVIQMFTKRGGDSSGRPHIDAEAGLGLVQTPYAGYGGVLRQKYALSVRGGSPTLSYNAGGSYSRTADYIPDGEISKQSNPSFYGGMRYERGIIAVDLSARYYAQENPQVFSPELFQSGFFAVSKPNYMPARYENQLIAGRLDLSPTPWWSSSLTLGVDRLSADATQIQPRLRTPTDTLLFLNNFSNTKKSIGANTSLHAPLTGQVSGSVTAGVDHYSLPAIQWLTFGAVNTTGTITTAPGQSVTASRTIVNNTGYFAQGQLAFYERLFVTAGVRGDQNSSFGDSLGTPVSPRVGVSFLQPIGSASLKLRGSWGEAIRAPDPALKQASASSFAVVSANPLLGPERQRGWDAGFDAAFGSTGSLGVTYYRQTALDLIDQVLVESVPLPTYQWQNIGRVTNTGVELEAALSAGPLKLQGQYGYVRSRIEQLAPTYGGDLKVGDQSWFTPKHTGGASFSVAPARGTTVTAGLTYVGSWTYYDLLAYYRCLGGTGLCRNTTFALRDYVTQFPSFTKLNASVFQQLTRNLSGFVTVDNLTNNESSEFNNTSPVFGRITTVGLRCEY